ncbi:hypothetical protein RGL50_004039 [Vibrio alginolyticus]|nr:hypothetical protein [Vibrio alginolyticus]
MSLLKEFVGSLLLLAVYIATAPILANYIDASECAKTMFDVDTVGEYLAVANIDELTGIKYHIWSGHKLMIHFVPVIGDADTFASYIQLPKTSGNS